MNLVKFGCESRNFLQHDTLVPLSDELLKNIKRIWGEEASRQAIAWYQEAVKLGNTDAEEYFRYKFRGTSCIHKENKDKEINFLQKKICNNLLTDDGKQEGTLRKDYIELIKNHYKDKTIKGKIEYIVFLDSLEAISKYGIDLSEEKNYSVIGWIHFKGERGTLYVASSGRIYAPTDCNKLFSGYKYLKAIAFDGHFDTRKATSMRRMFSGCQELEQLDLNSFHTENVTDMSEMFMGCQRLTDLLMNQWDMSNVLSTKDIFWGCRYCKELESIVSDIVNKHSK